MTSILHINTALEAAYVAISADERIIAEIKNPDQKTHASFLHPAIKECLEIAEIGVRSLSALSVIIGPGSYTGLRVGLSAAKGICFAAGIPLITINTLEWMVSAVTEDGFDFYCPMIDARRNEVFTGLYDSERNEIKSPFAHILNAESFNEQLMAGRIFFFGSGSEKAGKILCSRNAHFDVENPATCRHQSQISIKQFQIANFSDLAYVEPLYAKEFYTVSGPSKA